jgi:hypothetical protein
MTVSHEHILEAIHALDEDILEAIQAMAIDQRIALPAELRMSPNLFVYHIPTRSSYPLVLNVQFLEDGMELRLSLGYEALWTKAFRYVEPRP